MTSMRREITGLGARIHLFVRPEVRGEFEELFSDVLGCDVVERDFGLPYPIFLVSFPDGSSFSVEFSDLAPSDVLVGPVDDASAPRRSWIEFRTNDIEWYHRRLREAHVGEFRHKGSPHAYFIAPGGQVFRLLDVSYVGP